MKTFCANTILIWFESLLPSLLPFMIISNIMLQMQWEHFFVRLLLPLFRPIFRIHSSAIYTIISGFLFGFPMGAKVIGQLYSQQKLTQDEAEYLLSFCNHLSPIYCITFIAPLLSLNFTETIIFISIFYGVPLLYGILLRHTYYKKKIMNLTQSSSQHRPKIGFSYCLDQSITDALVSISKLGGYMVLFSAIGYIVSILIRPMPDSHHLFSTLYPILEISSGLSYYTPQVNEALFYLTFGGISCIFQTRSMLRNTNLTLRPYLIHKFVIASIILVIYNFIKFI